MSELDPIDDIPDQDATVSDADDRFLDALLERAFRHDSHDLQSRIDRSFQRISRDERANSLRSIGSVAAALALIAIAIWFLALPNSLTAQEALALAVHAEEHAQDREYRVQWTAHTRALAEQTSTLYLRGGDEFVIDGVGPMGLRYWAGCDGEVIWIVPSVPAFPVMVHDAKVGQEFMKKMNFRLPILTISSILEYMQEGFDVNLQQPEPGADSHDLMAVIGRARESKPFQPDEIVFRARKKTGIIEELEVTLVFPARFGNEAGGLMRTKVHLQIVSEEALPEDWFDHSAHHDGDRPVRDLRDSESYERR